MACADTLTLSLTNLVLPAANPSNPQSVLSGLDRFLRRHTIEMDESAVLPALRPLLNWLTEKVKGQ